MQKRQLVLSLCDKLVAFFFGCCLFKKCCMLNRQRRIRVKLVEQGAERIEKSLDVVSLVQTHALLRNFFKIMYDRGTRMMLLN
jgi:hypothetical protein